MKAQCAFRTASARPQSGKSCYPHQKSTSFDLSIFYPLRSNGISSTHEVRCISSAPSGLYIITRQRVSKLRNDDIQFLTELVIYKDFVFDDIHAYGVIEMRETKSRFPHQKSTSFNLSIFYSLRSNGISSTHEVRRISSAPLGLYIITRQRVSKLRNDDIQFLAELVIYKDFVFDDIHAYGVIEMREFKSRFPRQKITAILIQDCGNCSFMV